MRSLRSYEEPTNANRLKWLFVDLLNEDYPAGDTATEIVDVLIELIEEKKNE